MTDELLCWKCGASLAELLAPLERLAECPVCAADLHVCRLCEFYDTGVARSCREPVAEDVADKTRANFCDYFRARPGAYSAPDGEAASAARAELDALFGDGGASAGAAEAEPASDALEDLFRRPDD